MIIGDMSCPSRGSMVYWASAFTFPMKLHEQCHMEFNIAMSPSESAVKVNSSSCEVRARVTGRI